jgi:hypothetical protein
MSGRVDRDRLDPRTRRLLEAPIAASDPPYRRVAA